MTSKKFFIGAAAVALVLVGCSQPPVPEIDAAEAAMNDAEAAEAPQYASEAWDQARESVTAMEAEIEEQNAKFFLFRSYQRAGELAAQAAEEAQAAREAAVEGKEQAGQEAQEAVDAARAGVEQAQTYLADLEACGRRPKGFAADLEVMQGDVDALVAQLPELDAALAGEDFSGARARAGVIEEEASTLVADLEQAKTKLGC